MNNLENRRFGLLVAKKYLPGSKWICDCDCGNKKIVLANNLVQNKTLSCGCLRKRNAHVDITNQYFGFLLAKEPTDIVKNKSVVWHFKCECGNDVYATVNSVRTNGRKSCGCKTHDLNVKQAIYARSKCIKIDGTNVNLISSNKLSINNKSGYKGVCWLKKYKKWEASLRFKNNKYYLGVYDNIEDAVKARTEGEEHIYGPFLKWYEEYKKLNNKK